MNKNLIIAVLITAVVAGGAGYQMGARSTAGSSSVADATRGQGGQNGQFNQGGQNGGQSQRGRFRGNMINGEILSLDASGITVKLDDGTTRIVFIGDNTNVFETASSSKKSLTVGSKVRVSGEPGDAGSITATRIDVGAVVQMGMRTRDPATQTPTAQ